MKTLQTKKDIEKLIAMSTISMELIKAIEQDYLHLYFFSPFLIYLKFEFKVY